MQSILRSDLWCRLVPSSSNVSCDVGGRAVGSTPSLPHCCTILSPEWLGQELPQIGVNRIVRLCNSSCFQVLSKTTSMCVELELVSRICSKFFGGFSELQSLLRNSKGS